MSGQPRIYAEVVVDVPSHQVDRPFHYAVPPSMTHEISLGSRVLVPFGPRRVEGYVVGFSETPDVSPDKLKPILSPADPKPLFTPDTIALGAWMAKRYMCLLVRALQAVMPTGIKMESDRTVKLTQEGRAEADRILANRDGTGDVEDSLGRAQSRPSVGDLLIRLRESGGEALYDELVEAFGTRSKRWLSEAQERGLLSVEFAWRPPRVSAKRAKVVRLVPGVHVDEVARTLAGRAPRQAQALQALEEAIGSGDLRADPGGAVLLSEFVRAYGVSQAAVAGLASKGLVEIADVEIHRAPGAPELGLAGQVRSLTSHQEAAIRAVRESLDGRGPSTILLHGVTGSGKTEVYLRAIGEAVSRGKQAIVLVPEISLTPQTVERFAKRFGDRIAVFHSGLSLGERYDEWRRVRAGAVDVAIGARSAVFAPFERLGLIVIDEEHENTYKQEDDPRYHAREVAEERARLTGAVVVLGSATPSIESYHAAVEGRIGLVTMPSRVDGSELPRVTVVDMREELKAGNRSVFSRRLAEAIRERLEARQQTILFLNRRGHSTFVLCRLCGHVMKCPSCDVSLTYHLGEASLVCHYCDFREPAPETCPACGSKYIRHFGAGTEKIEEEVRRVFPEARVARMDVDTTRRKGAHERILSAFRRREVDILVGTQMIAKGLDFPGVTLVGVVSADTSLNLPDFRSPERTFQLLTQVAGRAGRGGTPGDVIIQTYSPDHYSIVCAASHDYERFYEQEIESRRRLGYPPFSHIILIVATAPTEPAAVRAINTAVEGLYSALGGQEGAERAGIEVLGPSPAPIVRLRGRYRWRVALKGPDLAAISAAASAGAARASSARYPDTAVTIHVDPMSML